MRPLQPDIRPIVEELINALQVTLFARPALGPGFSEGSPGRDGNHAKLEPCDESPTETSRLNTRNKEITAMGVKIGSRTTRPASWLTARI
jgi:hypothetical protein